jgi:hypothetical protein
MKKKQKVPQGAKVSNHRNALRNKMRLCVPACGPKARPAIVRRL